MKYPLLLLLTVTAPLIVSCQEEKVKEHSQKSTVLINEMEKNITQTDTKVGCTGEEKKKGKSCTEKDPAKFILATLKQESNKGSSEGILSIKENLNRSLEEIDREERDRDQLKANLIAFIDESNPHRGEDLQNFLDKIDKREKRVSDDSSFKSTQSIKKELNDLVALEIPNIKSKEVKKRLKNLISDITDSKKNLSQTKITLKKLVSNVDENSSASVTKFTAALIEDVSNNKINIIYENENYFLVKVEEGDNLSSLAQRYYNNKDKYQLIYNANRDKINSKYEIYPGSKLLIPKI